MLTNAASPRAIEYQLASNYGILIPADVDGFTLPPNGAPAPVIEVNGPDLHVWKITVDWTTSSNNGISAPFTMVPAPFNAACGGGKCIPQPGPSSPVLDCLPDRLMYRFSWRQFSGHDSGVIGMTVNVNNGTGTQTASLTGVSI